ncbi:hypothetical protein ACH5RR_028984 [Cinchona calisaya]|uniref:Uncharacterized protein n=1 Tax=Cinchona calisaya TaxID=153742 RepID=A0ABD2YVM1_9GENT
MEEEEACDLALFGVEEAVNVNAAGGLVLGSYGEETGGFSHTLLRRISFSGTGGTVSVHKKIMKYHLVNAIQCQL